MNNVALPIRANGDNLASILMSESGWSLLRQLTLADKRLTFLGTERYGFEQK
jgi:hypothetical protein